MGAGPESTRRRFTVLTAAAGGAALAAAAGAAFRPAGAAASVPLKIRELYNKDLSFSDRAQSLAGQAVRVEGFMAPPLMEKAAFFVLTKMPMATCPFCESEAEWPDDIVVVYTHRPVIAVPYNVKIVVRGELQLGTFKDTLTGFVSRVRIANAGYARA